MSLFRYLFDTEYFQRRDIEELKRAASRRRRQDRRSRRDTREQIEDLEAEVGELTLLCQALLETLRESGHVDPARLEEVMHRIDAADGVIDGRVTPQEEKPPEAPRRRRRT